MYVLSTSPDAVSSPQRTVCSPSPSTLQATSLYPLGKHEGSNIVGVSAGCYKTFDVKN